MAEHPFPVVGVGASAGGLTPLTQLLAALPPRPGLALVVIQHLDPQHESRLSELLQPHTSMTVVDAVHGAKVAPDHVYVIQPNTNVAIADGVLSVTPRPDDRRPHYPVDHFLRSLASVQGPYAVGVILSGTGSDGTLGHLRDQGGRRRDLRAGRAVGPACRACRKARSPAAPSIWCCRRRRSPRGSSALAQHPYLSPTDAPTRGARRRTPDEFQRVIAALAPARRASTSASIATPRSSGGPPGACCCAASRRPTTTRSFLERDRDGGRSALSRRPDQRHQLLPRSRDVRGAEARRSFRRSSTASPTGRRSASGCRAARPARRRIRSRWPCSSSSRPPRPSDAIQIFATDLGDPAALDKARAGLYPESIEAEVSPERLRRFFVKEDRHYRIQKSVRDLCVFARQNVTVDPPFSRVDLVTCRNVLIYMSPPLQERLLPVFHFALNPGGFLVLGLAETVGSFGDLFELANRAAQDLPQEGHRRAGRSSRSWPTSGWPARRRSGPASSVSRRATSSAKPIAWSLGRYAPPSVLVNHDFEVQQFRGRTSPFLETPSGQPTTNILRMAKEGLFMELRSALTEAKATNGPGRARGPARRRTAATTSNSRCASCRSASPTSPDVLPARAVRIEGLAGVVGRRASRYDEGRRQHADRDAAWLRQELASTQAVSAVDRRRAGGREPGAARRARGGAVEQRGAAEHQRRARDHQGGAAVGQRRADHRQRAVPEPQPRARRADRRPVELHQQRRPADGDRRSRSAHPAADAGGAEGLQPAADRRRPVDRAHQVLAGRRRHRQRSSTA